MKYTKRRSTKRRSTKRRSTKRTKFLGRGIISERARNGTVFTVSEEDIYNSVDNDSFEICGHMNERNYTFMTIGARDSSGRKYCDIGSAEKLWHTHPSTSKYYPSVEDLLKVLTDCNHSEIFTKYGKWIIFCNTKIPKNRTTVFEDELKKLTHAFYHATEKGRTYNEAVTLSLGDNISQYMIDQGLDYGMVWEPRS